MAELGLDLRVQVAWLEGQFLLGSGKLPFLLTELIIFVRGFSHAESKSEVHVFHDPGWGEPNSSKQWEMSQSLFILVVYFVRELLNEWTNENVGFLQLLPATLIFCDFLLFIFEDI